ncbi:MAG: 16S rRNA (cytidine(1402)-2'-O)-methyltransferase [Clostridia bacterium]|nr:16S rRNA (cytidine(1402)-2'-O)-methyltransferase [Clostridia bacterium]
MLYFVATPIGNLKDVSYRAIEILKAVDYIFCEDTRHSQVFLNHYEIKKPLRSYHKFNERESAEKICELLESGSSVAVISDAGMPVISDPGNILAQVLIEKGLEFTVVPGACAFLPALILSGFPSDRFTFIGFLPDKKKDAVKLLETYQNIPSPLIFYMPPHDIDEVVKTIESVLGNRKAVAVREITKIYEERIEFYLSDGYAGEKRGEFVLIVDGAKEKTENVDLVAEVNTLINLGLSKMDAIKQVAKEQNIKKNELYKIIIDSENE